MTGNGAVSEDEIRQTLSDLYGWTPEQFREKVIRPFVLRQNVTEAIASSDSIQQESRTRAEDVLAETQKGEKSFEDLAKEFGEDGTAADGGDLGFFERGTMVEEFQTAVESLEVGEVSEIVKTQFGFHVIKLEEKVPATAKEGEEPPAEGEFSYRARHILILYKGVDEVIQEKKDAVRFYQFI
ncbi:MAG: peptidyl-prolyl cis-trans isomerase [Candidatus Kerfeldbacteria bacterium]|nr:peptidyl-prolyl cis-trans isomerase [Candidatus Kerfeldbacteria bacterium]